MTKAVAIVSGGMDSVTLLYHLLNRDYQVQMISFDYGQRHQRELQAAAYFAREFNLQHTILDISAIGTHLKGSALTDSIPVPHGYYAEENMRQTVVPNRNMIMLSIAGGIAVASGAELLATGVHAGDHFIYPDCRPEFIAALNAALIAGNSGHSHPAFRLYTPYLYWTKVEIAQEGAQLGVPYDHTWTCYEGGSVHCGVCGACQERRAGFREAGILDPTVYADLTVFSKPEA